MGLPASGIQIIVALTIPEGLLADIRAHCRSAYPNECCGALVGTLGPHAKTVTQVVELENAEPVSPERRFSIDPRRLLLVEREATSNKLAIVGFYHSHPDSPARPSLTDLEWAWPVYSYVIVSTDCAEVVETRSFVLDDAGVGKRFVEEAVEILA